jgi:hypothetical protein
MMRRCKWLCHRRTQGAARHALRCCAVARRAAPRLRRAAVCAADAAGRPSRPGVAVLLQQLLLHTNQTLTCFKLGCAGPASFGPGFVAGGLRTSELGVGGSREMTLRCSLEPPGRLAWHIVQGQMAPGAAAEAVSGAGSSGACAPGGLNELELGYQGQPVGPRPGPRRERVALQCRMRARGRLPCVLVLVGAAAGAPRVIFRTAGAHGAPGDYLLPHASCAMPRSVGGVLRWTVCSSVVAGDHYCVGPHVWVWGLRTLLEGSEIILMRAAAAAATRLRSAVPSQLLCRGLWC